MRRLFFWRVWGFVNEPLRIYAERVIQGVLALGVNRVGLAVMDLVWRHQSDPGVMMILAVPVEEAAAEAFGVLDAAESLGEAWLILEDIEVAFGERVGV